MTPAEAWTLRSQGPAPTTGGGWAARTKYAPQDFVTGENMFFYGGKVATNEFEFVFYTFV